MPQSEAAPNDTLYKTSIAINAIYVLESLARGKKTGQDLYDTVIFPAKTRIDDLYTAFSIVHTKQDLLQKLSAIADAAREWNHRPIVHIEAHGGPNGLELADESVVSWKDLIPAFRAINIACKNNLVVVAMSCYGWNLTASLMPSDRAPVFMLIGPPNPIGEDDLLRATRHFYEALVPEFDMNKALEAMNEDRPFKQWPIRPATAEILYCRVFREYIEELGSPEALRDRENEIFAKLTHNRPLHTLDAATLRFKLRTDLANHEAAYYRHREDFLMLDLFPGDRERFGLTYDRCMPLAAKS